MKWQVALLFLVAAILIVVVAQQFRQATVEDDRHPLKGKTAPEVELPMLDGNRAKLSQQRGKVVVLDFWATWCGPCRQSMPHLQKVSSDKALAEKGLIVWSVNDRESADKITPFMKEGGYTFPVLLDENSEALGKFRVQGIPTTIIIGRDGTVKNAFVGFGEGSASALDNAIAAALAEPVK